MDGTAKRCQFYEPTGLAVEFDHNIYVCDFRSGAIKLITALKNTVKVLSSDGKFYNVFSIHEKGHRYESCSIMEAIELIDQCREALESIEYHLRMSTLIFQPN